MIMKYSPFVDSCGTLSTQVSVSAPNHATLVRDPLDWNVSFGQLLTKTKKRRIGPKTELRLKYELRPFPR